MRFEIRTLNVKHQLQSNQINLKLIRLLKCLQLYVEVLLLPQLMPSRHYKKRYIFHISNPFILFQTFSLVNKRMGKKVFFRFSKEKSLFFLSYTNPIRRFCIRLICTQWFDHFIIAVILINCVLLAADEEQIYVE